MPAQPPRKIWTREECNRIIEAGVVSLKRCELVQGKLISRKGEKWPHVIVRHNVVHLLEDLFGIYCVMHYVPIDVAPEDMRLNEPEPEAVVLKRDFRTFFSNIGPNDLHLVVEVADESLNFDLTVKAGLYARARIVDYWVVDMNRRRLIVHRDPHDGDIVRSRSVISIKVWRLLPPLTSRYESPSSSSNLLSEDLDTIRPRSRRRIQHSHNLPLRHRDHDDLIAVLNTQIRRLKIGRNLQR